MLEALRLSLNATAGIRLHHLYGGGGCSVRVVPVLYTLITPHKEFALIREGNTAAAVALGGSLVGFALPASNIIANSISRRRRGGLGVDRGGGAIAGVYRDQPGAKGAVRAYRARARWRQRSIRRPWLSVWGC